MQPRVKYRGFSGDFLASKTISHNAMGEQLKRGYSEELLAKYTKGCMTLARLGGLWDEREKKKGEACANV